MLVPAYAATLGVASPHRRPGTALVQSSKCGQRLLRRHTVACCGLLIRDDGRGARLPRITLDVG